MAIAFANIPVDEEPMPRIIAFPRAGRLMPARIGRWPREPLVHFVAAGALLFGAFAWLNPDSDAEDRATTIVVDRRDLLTFLQYRANAFEPETFGAALDGMTDAELEKVIDAYVAEEVLYREALALGLEQSDNIIRQRMVQKMSFLLSDLAAANPSFDGAALERYFRDNIDVYASEPWATFTHVFFDASERGADAARAAALQALDALNRGGARFNDATAQGDRFPYLRNYVERTLGYVASHFGEEFAASLEPLEPSATEWQGPLRSAYGEHLVLLTAKADRSYPEFEAVRGDVERDYTNELAARALDEMTDTIRGNYRIEIGTIRSTDP